MGVRSFRPTVAHLVALVAFLGITLAAYRLLVELSYSTSHGPHTSVLPIGLEVRTIRAARLDGLAIPARTRGVVVHDPPDEDSAYPGRLVGLRISDGPNAGKIIQLERTALRAD